MKRGFFMSTHHVRSKRHSIFWPLLLIVVGVILLLNTLGVISGSVWDILIRLWPLLFILGGLDSLFRGDSWVWGIISLGFGTAFLMANFGYLQIGAFSLLLRLWPLLLVAIGLDLIFSGRSAWMNALGVLIAIGIVAGIGWYAYTARLVVRGTAHPINQPLGEATRASLYFSDPVGWIDLKPGAESSQLVAGNIYETRANLPKERYQVANGTGSYSLSDTQPEVFPFSSGVDSPSWSLALNNQIPIELKTSTGVGRQTLDLSSMNLDNLDAEVALGSLDVTLPAEDEFDGTLSVPIGSLTVVVPQGVLVEMTLDTGITVRNLPKGFSLIGNKVYSPGANAQNVRIHLRVDQPIGVINIRAAQ